MRKLRRWENYALLRGFIPQIINTIFKSKYNQSRTLFSLILSFSLLFSNLVFAQEPRQDSGADGPTTISPVQTGSYLPERLWNLPLQIVNRQEGKEHIMLGDYKDNKLIILDFWATWCGPCLSSLNEVNSFYKRLPDDVLFLPVTYESKEKVQQLLNEKNWIMPSVYGDTILKKYFPHQSMPFVVWIKDGKVMSSTGGQYSKLATIEALLKDEEVAMLQDANVEFNTYDPVDTNNFLYRFEIGSRQKSNIGGTIWQPAGISSYNLSFVNMLGQVYMERIPEYDLPYRLRWEVADSVRIELERHGQFTGKYEEDVAWQEWLGRNTFCFKLETTLPNVKISRPAIRLALGEELRLFFERSRGVTFGLVKRKASAYVIRPAADYRICQAQLTSGSVTTGFRWMSLTAFLSTWRPKLSRADLPLLTKFSTGNAKMWLPDLKDASEAEIIKKLRMVGVVVENKQTEIEMLIIKPKNANL
ncbi:thioredoxin domain-containing protein [Sphingobacterium sp. JB170]|uniref:thioredoxin domain-containing protein n=1 Tax=Sphingobacterium sp. JB170 TaxID=1434842 RepID=UPI00097E849D|nr:thioredoxin domain-containing protein [Sphingobacterium sp. JB170]SJN49836.1 Thioredoxin [Sphingobacterium sp. JB170]